MIKTLKTALLVLSAVILMSGMSVANATLVNFEIEGTVAIGDETWGPGSNIFGLSAGDNIYATGTIDDSILGAGSNTVSFGGLNTLSIDVNGTIFTDADDTSGDGASFTFVDGALTNFDFTTATFNSLGTIFDDKDLMAGSWGTVTITPVPVPAALWLFGSGLLGLVGVTRRKKTA